MRPIHPSVPKTKRCYQVLEELPENDVKQLCSLLNIPITTKHRIDIVDKDDDEGLLLLHYQQGIHNLNDETRIPLLEKIAHVRGIIVDVSQSPYKIVCSGGFGYTSDWVIDEPEEIKQLLPTIHENPPTVTKAYEGTILRMYQAPKSKEWKLATYKKLNAYFSSWGGSHFGKQFFEAWEDEPGKFPLQGKEGYSYTFLLSHSENKLVCDIEEPKLYLTSIQKNKEDGTQYVISINCDWEEHKEFLSPRVIFQNCLDVSCIEDITEEFNKLQLDCTGLLVVYDSRKSFKLVSPEYQKIRDIRGHEPDVVLRMFELYRERDFDDLNILCDRFDDKVNDYEEFLGSWKKLPFSLMKKMKKRYPTTKSLQNKNLRVQFDKEEHIVIEKARLLMLEDSGHDYFSALNEALFSTNSYYIRKMIRRMNRR